MADELFIGLMSGTSMDGVDGVLIDLAPQSRLQILAHSHRPYTDNLRQELLALNQPGENELHRCALAANAVSRTYAAVVSDLLALSHRDLRAIKAIGAHGQTVRHQPLSFDGVGYSTQLLAPQLLAELSGLPVISNFRSRDLAAGGQGAPLVPAFHEAVFAESDTDRVVLNIGGIANVTLLPAAGPAGGYDCGPGNVLLDFWCARHTGHQFDHNGNWGRSGQCHHPLLLAFMKDAYIQRKPPKSTGRDHFHAEMLETILRSFPRLPPADVQSTLTHFTAEAAAKSILTSLPTAHELLVCGGGALNTFMMDCLRQSLPQVRVRRTDEVTDIDPMHVEAAAFAWLAQAHVKGLSGNLPTVTGARGRRILGDYSPA